MKKFYYSWGHGSTDSFLALEGKTPQIFDVEFDREYLHQACGGRTTYISRSGECGEGFFDQPGSLIPVGMWQVILAIIMSTKTSYSSVELSTNTKKTSSWRYLTYRMKKINRRLWKRILSSLKSVQKLYTPTLLKL